MDWKTLLFSFGGRLNRGKYWLGVVISTLVYIAAAIIFGILYVVAGTTGSILGGLVGVAAFVAVIWIGLAISINRLHDREKSGWWLLLFLLGPVVVGGVGTVLSTNSPALNILFSVASFGISIWALVELGCMKGTTGPNLYGPDPLPIEAHAA